MLDDSERSVAEQLRQFRKNRFLTANS